MRFLILVVLAFASFPVTAADFAAPILGPDGRPLMRCTDRTPECSKLVTLGMLASEALFDSYADETDPRTGESHLSGMEKANRAALGLKLYGAGKLDLKAEDVSLLKSLIGKKYAPLVVLRAYQLLDPAGAPQTDK